MRALVESGVSQSDAARQLGLSLRTVQRWIRAGAFPERTQRQFPNSVDKYAAYLDRRLLEGCRNVNQLWRELQQQGFRGQNSRVWHWLRQTPWASSKDVQRCALEIYFAGFVSADGLADTQRNAFSPALPGGAVSLLPGNSPAGISWTRVLSYRSQPGSYGLAGVA
jgi:hypothetical protein